LVERLVIYPENMLKNLDRLGGLVHSQRVLLALTQKGVARETAYAAVQRNAMRVWRGEGAFSELLMADPDVRPHLNDAELAELFDLAYHFKNLDVLFERAFGA
jgi:adenylosuccinate lyase